MEDTVTDSGTDTLTDGSPRERPGGAPTGLLLFALIVGGITPILDTTLVALALHSLSEDLHASLATIQWVSTGYLLALAVAIPFVAWAQSRWGGKRVWLAALAVFTLASLLCACAWSAPVLIAFRILQGLGGGVMTPLLMTLAMQSVPPEARTRTMTTVSLPTALAPVIGPVLAGIILSGANWQWLFLINVPLGIVGLVLAALFLPEDRPGRPSSSSGTRPRLDVLGAILLAPGLAAMLYGLSQAHGVGGVLRGDVLIPFLVGALLVVTFVMRALRAANPLVDVRLLRLRSLVTASTAMTFVGAVLFAGNFLLPLWFQQSRGLDPLDAALLLIPQGVGTLLVRMAVPRLVQRLGVRTVAVAGSLIMAAPTVPFAVAGPGTALWLMSAVLFVRGLGNGLVFIPVMTAAYDDVASQDMPHASAITRIAQQLGGALGTAGVATALTASTARGGDGFGPASWTLIVIGVLGALASMFLRKTPQD
jgi:EmrB/QacA subfamily drug resistance transporter